MKDAELANVVRESWQKLDRIKIFWADFKGSKTGVVGLFIVMAAVTVAVLTPIISPYNPDRIVDEALLPLSFTHLMGTDSFGRDVFSGIIWGTRVSLTFAAVSAGIAALIGIFLGGISGYYGGGLDALLSRIFDMFLVLPRFFLMILVIAFFGQNIVLTMLVVGITAWPSNARLFRAQVLTLKTRDFVHASIGLGGSNMRVLVRHILPNGINPVVVNSTMQAAWAVLIEASLSFLGLGDPNLISWGQMLYWAQDHIQIWWLSFFPGMAIILLALGLNFMGDGMAYLMNPHLRQRARFW
jgi:peptide/nickel transport system permease protein